MHGVSRNWKGHAMTRGGARPNSGPAPIEGVKRSETLRVRVTPDEKAACVRLVDDSGYETESDWLRSLIRREIANAALIDALAMDMTT